MKKTTLLAVLILLCAVASCRPRSPTINISYVEAPFNLQIMVMREQEMLEQAFAPLGINVRWHTITSGADQANAMAAGSLDIASVINSTSVILANAAGNTVDIAALVSRPRQTFALMVAADGPRNIRELKGKTIAGPRGSVLHQMLVAALAEEGLDERDVSFIHMGLPEARTALLANRVDGALLAAALIIRSEEAGKRTLFTADGYLTPLLFTAVRPAFAHDYPDLLQIYLEAQRQAYNWIAANTAEAIALGSRLQQVSPEDGAQLFHWSGIANAMEVPDITALEADTEFLYQQNMISQKPDPRHFILPYAFAP